MANAFSYCLSQQNPGDGIWNGNFFGLISVGQLRHFKTRYPYAMEVNRPEHDFEHGRLFRINAIKTGSGWYELFTGKEVQFHHYPGFNPKAGRPGDSLIWDSKYDKLFTAGAHETFQSLCSTRRNDSKHAQNTCSIYDFIDHLFYLQEFGKSQKCRKSCRPVLIVKFGSFYISSVS